MGSWIWDMADIGKVVGDPFFRPQPVKKPASTPAKEPTKQEPIPSRT